MRYTQAYLDNVRRFNNAISELENMISMVNDEINFGFLMEQVRLTDPNVTDMAFSTAREMMINDLQQTLNRAITAYEHLLTHPEFEPSPVPPNSCKKNIPRGN
jgi:hypothetical protein